MGKFEKLKGSLDHIKKVKNVKWLLPGWVFYEYYKIHKRKGNPNVQSLGQGAKAEAIRLVAMAGIPLPGTYELTTTGLALLKKKLESGEVEKLNLRAFKDFIPLKKLKQYQIKGRPYLRIFYKDKKLYFEIFYKHR